MSRSSPRRSTSSPRPPERLTTVRRADRHRPRRARPPGFCRARSGAGKGRGRRHRAAVMADELLATLAREERRRSGRRTIPFDQETPNGPLRPPSRNRRPAVPAGRFHGRGFLPREDQPMLRPAVRPTERRPCPDAVVPQHLEAAIPRPRHRPPRHQPHVVQAAGNRHRSVPIPRRICVRVAGR